MSAAGSAAAISIIKHLQSLGHKVIGIDANKNSESLAKFHCDEFYLSPLCNDPNFIPFINSLVDQFDLYIPFIDEELLCLTNSQQLLPEVMPKIILNNNKAINDCTSKIKFQHFCQQNNLPVAALTTAVPAIFKPEYGRGSKGIFIIEDEELIPYFQKKTGVIQQLISGVEYTIDVLMSQKNEWLFAVARKRIETAGVSRIGEIDQHPAVLRLVKQCTEKFQFKGPINIQIMLDHNNEAHLIEINPRLAGSLIFSTLAGFDILDLAIKDWLGQPYKLPLKENILNRKFVRYWQEHIC
jgi:carbamoyl-phosphate synthase large subunit